MRLSRTTAAPVLVFWLAFGPAAGAPPENVSSADPRTPAAEKATFHLPEGFEAQLVASEPEIQKPLNIAFDARGRLWVTETLEYPFPAGPGTTPRDGVAVLSDFGPDGRARTVTRFATGLNIPIGVLPMTDADSALVHSIPNVLRLTDTDGDGRADSREPVYQTYGARDTHGMTNAFTWGFDGWVYACHGFSNESRVAGRDRAAITMQSGNVYRMRPDGSHVEYFSHGQVNPFGLAFDPLGNLYASDCHSRPIYQLLRGAWYPSFGKPDDGLGFGPEMCTHDHYSTAISGIVYLAGDHFPADYNDTIFTGNVVTNRVNHDKVVWHGATPEAVHRPDFLVSDDPWFRPVDLEMGPDGALYVADFYNRIIGHYEVPLTHPGRDRERGRIWRVVYTGKGAGAPAPPRDGRISDSVDGLVGEIGHPNLAVRTLAANRLSALCSDPALKDTALKAVRAAASGGPTWRRVHALWVLQRVGALDGEALAAALTDADRAVRVHAFRIVGERDRPDDATAALTRKALADPDALVRRTAAESLARHPGPDNIPPLLTLRGEFPETNRLNGSDDTHLVHAVRMALRDQLRDDRAWPTLDGLKLSDRAVRDVADVATGVPSAGAARFLLGYMEGHEDTQANRLRFIKHVARYGDAESDARLLTLLRKAPESQRGEPLRQFEEVKAFQQGLQERGASPAEGLSDLAKAMAGPFLGSEKPELIAAGVGLAGSFKLKEYRGRLAELATAAKTPDPKRLEVLNSLGLVDPEGVVPVLAKILGDAAKSPALRDKAAGMLAANGRPEAREALVSALPTAPEKVQTAIAAALATTKPGAEALLDAVARGKTSARLLQGVRVAGLLASAGVADLDARLKTLLNGLPPADQATETLIALRRAGFARAASKADAGAGAKVFETHCAACHQIGGKGAKVGPQLDGVGVRGLDRLLEDVLDPSRNVDQTFRLTRLDLADGRVVSGLLLREEGEVLVMADAQGKDVRVDRKEVDARAVFPLSPMPANFSEQIAEPDFHHLMAYLLANSAAGVTTPERR